MFKNLQTKIKELAKTAVIMAENALGSEAGKQKKEMAIEYIVSRIPVLAPFKKIVSMVLSGFIDDAIEMAVEYMNSTAE